MSLGSLQDTMKHFILAAAPFNKLPHFYVVSTLKLNLTVIFFFIYFILLLRDTTFGHHVVTLTEQRIDSSALQHVPQQNPKSKSRLVSPFVVLWGTSSKCYDICSAQMRPREDPHYHVFYPPNLLELSQHVTVTFAIFKWPINQPLHRSLP